MSTYIHRAAALALALQMAVAIHSQVAALPLSSPVESDSGEIQFAQLARTCKEVRTCEEAVRLWCGGYGRADGDNDGIPCENVCHSRKEVDEIRRRIGC